jgi:RNA polymerase sigma-70 factor (ECF subfamily)
MTRKEYNTTVDNFADGLYRFILKNMRDEDAAKDVVQDVFEKLWHKHENVQFEKAKSYIFTAGYRTMIDVFRKNKRSADFEEVPESSYAHSTQYSDLGEILERAVQKLPPDQRSAVMLRDYEGYSYQEIGEILSLNESQVKVYIFRARKTLQKYLKSVEAVL